MARGAPEDWRPHVKLEVRVRAGRAARLELIGVPNTGYGGSKAQLMLPLRVAERLGWWPRLPPGTVRREYRSASGPFYVDVVPKRLLVRVAVPDRRSQEVVADGVISSVTDEVLISSVLAGLLEIALVDLPRGIWCFRDELGKRRRRSEPRQLW